MRRLLAMGFGLAFLVVANGLADENMLGPGPMWDHRACGHEMVVKTLTKTLALSDAQVADFESILAKKERTIEPLFDQVRERHESIQESLQGGNADPTEVGQLMIEAHGLMTQVGSAEDAARQALRAILTTDQREKLEAFEHAGPGRRPGPGQMPFHPWR